MGRSRNIINMIKHKLSHQKSCGVLGGYVNNHANGCVNNRTDNSAVFPRAQFQNKIESSTSPSQGRRGLAFATLGFLSLSLSLS